MRRPLLALVSIAAIAAAIGTWSGVSPHMFGGAKAFTGSACTDWAP
jgi:hypothetical protein